MRMTAAKIAKRIELIAPLAHRRRQPLKPFEMKTLSSPADAVPLDADGGEGWQTISPLSYWGEADFNFVMRGTFAVPTDFGTDSPVALHLPLGESGDFSHPEALAYIDGKPYATADRHHQEFQLAPQHLDGAPHALVLHGWTGLLSGGKKLQMRECAVVQIDPPTRTFIALARTALQAATLLDDLEPVKTRLMNALDDAFRLLDTLEPFDHRFYQSVPAALGALRAGIEAAGMPLDVEIIAAGHAHIDVAWLWTLDQTRRKAGRTFHSVLRLMEQFPDYHFTQSQPQLYAYVQRDYPELFEAIKQRVAEGRWEPIGGMWIEADCNVTGPESLARQFLLGRAYFRKHFGQDAESPVLWLPDVFGYAWNLPQLIKLAGLEYFFTIKIGWNQVNKLPYDSFWWQGLDGTKVLTHFSTTPEHSWSGGKNDIAQMMSSATYNADLDAFAALGTWAKLKHKESQRVMLMSYGWGDGGGGPTREMNENAQALGDFPALPRVKQGKVIDFFRRLENESGHLLPTWNSELYLEIHRGTYTTQSRNKRANRKSEFMLHDAEFLAVFARLLDANYTYPQQTFNHAWETVCLNQFHDIIPGSSIGEVYVDSQRQYAEIRSTTGSAAQSALDSISSSVGGDVLLINPTSFDRADLVFLPQVPPAGKILSSGSQPAAAQSVEGGILLDVGHLAPFSITPFSWADAAGAPPATGLSADRTRLENNFVRVNFNASGDIVGIYDKVAGRNVLPEGSLANQWQAFEDRPSNWDAWDIDIFYDDKLFLAEPAHSIELVESGPLRATLEIKRRIINSEYTQHISLAHNRRQIDFETTIEWRERHVLLKAAFPVDVLSPAATYEVQWGNVQRPTHRNTSWDWARFETCAQKWVDLSEGGYGVALLNDCKYGHDIRDNVVRITLLRAPTSPDPEADQGEHHFAYSLMLHGGEGETGTDFQAIARQAYLLNDAVLAVPGSGAPITQAASLISASGSAIIETVKQAEDGEGIIVRLYESARQRGWVTLKTGFAVGSAHVTNLLEENQESLTVTDQQIKFYLKPFQIVTLRLVPA